MTETKAGAFGVSASSVTGADNVLCVGESVVCGAFRPGVPKEALAVTAYHASCEVPARTVYSKVSTEALTTPMSATPLFVSEVMAPSVERQIEYVASGCSNKSVHETVVTELA